MNASLLVIVALFVLFWLLLIRPQRRRQRAHEDMIAAVNLGDEIVTAGGLYGEVTAIHDDELQVEIADGVEVRIARRAVAGVMPDEDEEELEEAVEDDAEDAGEEAVAEARPPSKATDES